MKFTKSPRSAWLATLVMASIVLLPSLYGFGGKFLEFIAIFRGHSDGVFAITPILNYLLASLGFFCLFGWALLCGSLRDIEAPKRSLLENEAWLDARSAVPVPSQQADLSH